MDGGAELRSPTCGSRVSIAVQLDERPARRARCRSRSTPAPSARPRRRLLEQHAIGRAHDEVADALVLVSRWLAREQDDAEVWPGLGALAPARTRKGRHGAILLPFRALLAAMESAT